MSPRSLHTGTGTYSDRLTWLTAAILKIGMTSYFSNGCSDLDEIRQPDAEWHTDYGEMVDGGRLYFEIGSSYISAAIWDISTKFGVLIDFDLLKAVTSTDTKPEVNSYDVIRLSSYSMRSPYRRTHKSSSLLCRSFASIWHFYRA